MGASAAVAIWYGVLSIDRVDIPALQPADELPAGQAAAEAVEVEELTDVLNVLVVGSDDRDRLTDDQLLALGTEREAGLRTDTLMLVQLDPRREKVAILSFPRDLLLDRCDGTRGRINAAYAIGEAGGVGGPTCLVRTITDFTGIPINHFIQVDFAGFIDVVDALGGVRMYLDEPISDRAAGVDLPQGCVELDGATALGFVRARKIDNDFGRIARQQRFIHEVVKEAASLGTLVNPPRLFALVDAGASAVETDRQLSLAQMRRIAFSLRDLGTDHLDMRTVPATPRRISGADYVVADEDEAEELFRAFRDGTLVPQGLGTEEPQPVDVDDIPAVVVLNGAGIAGLAGQAATAIEDAGVEVAETGNAERFDFARTQVVYPERLLEEAEVLAEVLGGARLVPAEEDSDLTVVLGSDWDSDDVAAADEDDDETLTATPTPSPSPSPTFAGAAPGRDC
jgi:LCP family protein required for cell wall assembly